MTCIGGNGVIGRDRELAEVGGLLAAGRVLTLTGIGGAGKTRIARRMIADATAEFPAGVWVVELADLADPALLTEVVAGSLDLQVPASASSGSVLTDFFAQRPGLLVLDNCEHLNDAVADLLTTLLAACPELTALTTSRLPLGISRETVYQVLPLSAPEPGTAVGLDESARYDAIALYVQRATEVMASFRLTADNVAAVADLVTRLDGVPLAIELAAARVRVLSPDSLLDRISERFVVLESDLRDVPARQRSLTASVGWSYELCAPAEQVLWNRLSVFAGGFELEAAEHVCSGDGIATEEVLGLLSVLVDMSVVARIGETGARYRMLEPIRQFGSEQLASGGDLSYWRTRHLDWYADLVRRLDAEWVGPDQLAWMDRLRAEHPNLRAALEHALSDPCRAVTALQMCVHLEPLWFCGGHFGEARRWIERGVVLADDAHAEKVAALRLCAWFGALQLDLDYATEQVEAAARLVDDGDDLTRGHYQFAAGVVASWKQDLGPGAALLAESEAAYLRSGSRSKVLVAKLNLVIAHVFAEDYASAAEVCRACLEIAEPLGEVYVSAYARWALGLGALMSGDLAGATGLEHDALAKSSSLGDQLGTALALETLAWIAAIQFDVEQAVVLLGGAHALWRMMNMSAEQPGVSEIRTLGEKELRAAVDPAVFEASFAKGLSMPPQELVELALGTNPPPADGQRNAGPLSRRETEVAALVAEGLTNRDIAERLFLSERTAQGHVQSILRKLGFGSRSQVAVWYVGQVS